MKSKKTSFAILYYSIFTISLLSIVPKCFGQVGTTSFTVEEGNATNPTYYIASAPLSTDVVFTGQVSGFNNSNNCISFDTDTNSSGAIIYPFHGDNVFLNDVQIPEITVTVTSGQVVTTSVTYFDTGFDTNKPGFTDAPEIVLYDAEFEQSAELNASIDSASGELTGINIVDAGQGYTSAPKVRVVAGPHFVKITDSASPYKGRVFLISDNNKTHLTLDMSRIAQDESDDVGKFFPVGTQVEIIPASTLGSLFGVDHESSSFPENWQTGHPKGADTDLIYLWDVAAGLINVDYSFHIDLSLSRGWYTEGASLIHLS